MTKQSLGLVALVSVLSLSLFALPAGAAAGGSQGNGRGNGKNDTKNTPAAKNAGPAKGNQPVSIVFVIDRDGHRRAVSDFYTRGTLPPGLAKRESLPPGLSQQLRENGSLPPGLQKHLTPVPAALVLRLPVVPVYYSRYFLGPDLVVINTRTSLIVLIVRDIRP